MLGRTHKGEKAFSEKRGDLERSSSSSGHEKRFDEAQSLLEEATRLLGDQVEVRLQRARLSVTKGGPQVVKDLNELAQNLDAFSKADRRKLLNGLAVELRQQQDLQDAIRLWSRLAEQEPKDLELRLTLLDLAFQTANGEEISKNIKQIAEIEGGAGLLGGFCQVRYLIWQAQQVGAKTRKKHYDFAPKHDSA